MSELHGTWRNETNMMGMMVELVQEIRPDGSYETRMAYPTPHGGTHKIFHFGQYTAEAGSLVLNFESGKTERVGCNDPSNDFELRDLNTSELEETKRVLADPIPFEVEGDELRTSVQSPMGPMKVTYTRVT